MTDDEISLEDCMVHGPLRKHALQQIIWTGTVQFDELCIVQHYDCVECCIDWTNIYEYVAKHYQVIPVSRRYFGIHPVEFEETDPLRFLAIDKDCHGLITRDTCNIHLVKKWQELTIEKEWVLTC